MSILSAPEIDYQQQTYSHPTYKYLQFYPNTFGQAITIGSALNQVTINLPPNECINFAKSYLTWYDSITNGTAGALTYWIHNDTVPEINRMQLQPSNSTYLVDIDYFQNYFQLSSKAETNFGEFMCRDPFLENMVPCNCLNANNLKIGSSNTNTAVAGSGSVNYTEPAYLYTTGSLTNVAGGNNANVYNISRMLKLGDIKNSFMSIDKDVYFGGQISYLKLWIGTSDKFGFSSTNAGDPITGAALLSAAATTIQMNNLTLYLAVESNELIRQDIMQQVQSEGLRYMIPYVQAYKNLYGASSTQQLSIQLDVNSGQAFRKIYWSLYNNTESGTLAYDHSNINYSNAFLGVVPFYGSKIYNFWSLLNGKRLQDITIDSRIGQNTAVAAAGTMPAVPVGSIPLDWMSLKNKLKGSVIQNSQVYQANWFWLDDFTGFSSIMMQNGCPQIFSGIPMSAVALVYGFNAYATTTYAYNHYAYSVFFKELNISTSLVTVV
jgi:hypothetical protein